MLIADDGDVDDSIRVLVRLKFWINVTMGTV